MVITSLQEKQNRKFYVPIRPGNRGGWSLFQWDAVREKPYRDRQMYLGNSAVIGVLGKGGKWRKMDWYLKANKKYKDPNLTSEQQQAIKRDMERMKNAFNDDLQEDDEKLTEEEMKQLMKKIKNKDGFEELQKQAVGLGFDKSRVEIKAKPTATKQNTSRLEGIDQIGESQPAKKIKRQKQRSPQEQSRSRSVRKQKKQKKKKEKKEKKDKKHKRSRSRSRSGQKERSEQKQRDRQVERRARDRSESHERSRRKHRRSRQRQRQQRSRRERSNSRQHKHKKHRDYQRRH